MACNADSQAGVVLRILRSYGFDFFVGLPDSALRPLFDILKWERDVEYITAASEYVAVGLAAGAVLAGRRAVVLMQSSGLALALNAYTSLALVYDIPMLTIVSWRGALGEDLPQYSVIGRSLEVILDAVGMPWRIVRRERVGQDIQEAVGLLLSTAKPTVALLHPEALV